MMTPVPGQMSRELMQVVPNRGLWRGWVQFLQPISSAAPAKWCCDSNIHMPSAPPQRTGRRVRNVEEYPYHISICYMRGTWSKWHRCYCRHVFIASVVLQWTNTRVQLNMKMRDVDWHLAKHRIVGLSRLEFVGYTNAWIGKSLSMSADTYSMLSTKAMLSSSNNPPRSDYMLDL